LSDYTCCNAAQIQFSQNERDRSLKTHQQVSRHKQKCALVGSAAKCTGSGRLMLSAWPKTLLLICAALASVAASVADEDCYYQTHVDAGYAASNCEPSNNIWHSKGTTTTERTSRILIRNSGAFSPIRSSSGKMIAG